MSQKPKILAIIPARGGSKGLPGKNAKHLMGKPLVAWPIKMALETPEVSKVVVSTDCQNIADLAAQAGAIVPFLRPAKLAADNSSSVDVALHAIDFFERSNELYDYVALLEPTSPLTEAKDLSAAIKTLIMSSDYASGIVGVTEMIGDHPAYALSRSEAGLISPAFSADFKSMPRRQELPKLHCLDGSFYISSVGALKRSQSFYTENTLGHNMPKWKSFEIDDLVDFYCVEAILKNKGKITNA